MTLILCIQNVLLVGKKENSGLPNSVLYCRGLLTSLIREGGWEIMIKAGECDTFNAVILAVIKV